MELLLLWPLWTLIRSDFRERQVRLFTLLLFGGLQWGICVMQAGVVPIAGRVVENLLLLTVWGCGLMFCLSFYRRLRSRKEGGFIGKGDIAFLFCLLPVFPLRELVIFLLCSFGAALLWWWLRGRSPKETIPLVSVVGICYLPVLIFRLYGS